VIPQFTKIAAGASISGGSLFLFLVWNKVKWRKVLIAFSVILTLMGTMLRFNTLNMVLPFLLLQFAFYTSGVLGRENDKISRKCVAKKILVRFVACLALIGTAYFVSYIGSTIWNSKESYKDYRIYNSLRSSVTDVNKQGYDSVRDAFQVVGYDDVDYYMINSWNFYDKDIYSDEKMEFVATVFRDRSNKETHSLEYVIDQLAKRDYTSYHIFVGFVILAVIMVLLNPRSLVWHIGSFVVLVFLLGLFFWMGRVVYRVEYGVFYGAVVTVLFCGVGKFSGSCRYCRGDDKDSEDYVGKKTACSLLGVAVVAVLFNIFHFIPDTSYKTMDDEKYRNYVNSTLNPSWDYISDKYRINVNSRKPYGNLIDFMENDSEGYYLLDFSSCIQLIYYDYKPWIRMEQGYFDENYMYLGGVLMQYPAERELFSRHGLDPDNPYKDIVKDGIYVVDNRYSDVKLQYLRKYYYPNARKVLVDTIDGFKIWKYYED
jgi:hypothetical protein